MSAPFRVYKSGCGWFLQHRRPVIRNGAVTFPIVAGFETAGDAIDYAYKQWPWCM